eukprot:gene7117-14476_t
MNYKFSDIEDQEEVGNLLMKSMFADYVENKFTVNAKRVADILDKYQPDLSNLQLDKSYKFNALQYAIENTTLAVMTTILDYNPDNPTFKLNVNKVDPSPRSSAALSFAVSRGNLNAVKLLIGYGADPRLCDNEGWTALHSAVEQKNTNIAELLLHLGAYPNQVAYDYYSPQEYYLKDVIPLHVAVTSRNPMPMVSLLVAYGADINMKCQYIYSYDYAEDDESMLIYELRSSELYSNYGKNKKKEIECNNAVEQGRRMRISKNINNNIESDNKQTHIGGNDDVGDGGGCAGITEGLGCISSNYCSHDEDIEKVSITLSEEYNTTTTSEHSSSESETESDNEIKRPRLV